MREEKVTKNILDWLEENGWKIICFDFPQSGTGVLLHPNCSLRKEKNKGGIIPDIIAVKDDIALFFENKDRFYEPDFEKIYEIKTKLNYSNALNQLLSGFNIKSIYYGISIPELSKEVEKSRNHFHKIDFFITTNNNNCVIIHHDINKVFLKEKQ